MRRFRLIITVVVGILLVGAGFVAYSSYITEADIETHVHRVEDIGRKAPSIVYNPDTLHQLPPPVARYFKFTFVDSAKPVSFVNMEMAGQFRRPLSDVFEPTTASQTAAAGIPAMIFSATTPVLPGGIWARVYDAFMDGKMEMKAKLLSTLTIVDERESPLLNTISLRRWLLESPLYPSALLPGGPVRWQAIDEKSARAIVSNNGIQASLIATFRPDGSLERFDAEEDGDLNTPYHGSGEHVSRSDYQLISGLMIPMSFTIARAAAGKIYPFWKGKITSIDIEFSN